MKYVNLRSSVIAGFLLSTSCASFGVTLGSLRGGALVGRTLDVMVPARLDRGDDPASLCIEAELAYSETGIDARKLSIVTSPAAEPGQANIRITSSAIVDEPVVTLIVRAGCSVKNSRRYVLLADLPVDAVQSPQLAPPPSALSGLNGPAIAGRASPLEASQSRPRRSTDSGAGTERAAPRTTQASPRRARVDPSSGSNEARSANTAPRSRAGNSALVQSQRLGEVTARNPGASRLRLDSADLLTETFPTLKSSAELQTAPADSDARRPGFAALWRVLNLRPEELTRDMQRLEEVQAQAQVLRETNNTSQVQLGSTREQLKKAQAERFANPLVYALAALSTLLLILAIYLYLRSQRPDTARARGTWWDLREGETGGRRDSRALQDLTGESAPTVIRTPLAAASADEFQKGRSMDHASHAGSGSGDSNYPASGMAVSPRGVNVNELFDIAQQADFFVSLGQHDHAIEVLSNHIRENAQTSPLAYLDLFKIFHELDRKSQYDDLRIEFNRIFNAEVPAFKAFRERGEGLEAYEGAMTRIQSLWNTPKVLEVIEESIFRKPGRQADAFGLEAYRELLLLYAIAHELVDVSQSSQSASSDPSSSAGRSFATGAERDVPQDYAFTELQPLGASLGQARAGTMPPTMPAALDAERVSNFSLDIDLSEPWLDLGYADSDSTVVLPARKLDAYQPPSSAWLDFDLSEIRPDGEPEGIINADSGSKEPRDPKNGA